MPIKPVHVVVKGKPTGQAVVVPYSKEAGLQVFPDNRPVRYQVPSYEVWVDAVGPFRSIRFGLRNRGTTPPPVREVDAGLARHRICQPTWVPGYSPHSFQGTSRPGAWRLIPGENFLIHEGPGERQAGGSIGCVEILDGMWKIFLHHIETLGGGTCQQISAAKKIKVTLESAAYPTAILLK